MPAFCLQHNDRTLITSDVRSGSKAEKLNASKCFPLCPQEPTSSARPAMSVECQQRTCRPRNPTSVLPPRPDIVDQAGHVGLVPKTEVQEQPRGGPFGLVWVH